MCSGVKEIMGDCIRTVYCLISRPSAVCHEVRPVGNLDAATPKVRFDERGWETERWHRLRHQQTVKSSCNGYSLSPKPTTPIFESTRRLLALPRIEKYPKFRDDRKVQNLLPYTKILHLKCTRQ